VQYEGQICIYETFGTTVEGIPVYKFTAQCDLVTNNLT